MWLHLDCCSCQTPCEPHFSCCTRLCCQKLDFAAAEPCLSLHQHQPEPTALTCSRFPPASLPHHAPAISPGAAEPSLITMPSILRKFKPFGSLRERARSAKSQGARGDPEADTQDTDDSRLAGSTAHVTAPAVSPDQQQHPQQPVAAAPTNDKACPAPATTATVVSSDTAANAQIIPDTEVADMVRGAANSSSCITPPSLPAPPAPPTAACMLETLPAELRIQVFSHISDLGDLRALVLASPVFSQQYCLDRKQILGQVLVRTLGNLMAEAHAIQNAPMLYSRGSRPPRADTVRQFIHNYVSRRLAPPELVLQDCTLADLDEMAAFYQTVARPLVLECAALFLQNLDPSLHVGNLSATEQTRIIRALYGFELFCNLFGQGSEPGRVRMRPILSFGEVPALIFGSLHPWEVEEINCIYVLIRNKYNAVFDTVGRDLVSPWIPSRDDQPRTPVGLWDSNEGSRCLPLTPGDHNHQLQRA